MTIVHLLLLLFPFLSPSLALAAPLLSEAILRGEWGHAENVVRNATGDVETRDILLMELRKATSAVARAVRAVDEATVSGQQQQGGGGDGISEGLVRVVSPSLQWAQDAKHVWVEAKFSHRWGAPAMTSVKDPEVQFLSRRVRLRATPPGGAQRFELDLSLYGSLNTKTSSWSPVSAGRLTLTLSKATPKHWDTLWDPTDRSPPTNVKYWFEKQESIADYDSGWMKSGDDAKEGKNDTAEVPGEEATPSKRLASDSAGVREDASEATAPSNKKARGISSKARKVDKALKKAQKSAGKKAEEQKKEVDTAATKRKKAVEEVQWKRRAALRNEMNARIAFLGLGDSKASSLLKQRQAHWAKVLDGLFLPASLQQRLRIALAVNPFLWRWVVLTIDDARQEGAFGPLLRQAPSVVATGLFDAAAVEATRPKGNTEISPFPRVFGVVVFLLAIGGVLTAFVLGRWRAGARAVSVAILLVAFACAYFGVFLGALLFVH
jgi:hypothetical protein